MGIMQLRAALLSYFEKCRKYGLSVDEALAFRHMSDEERRKVIRRGVERQIAEDLIVDEVARREGLEVSIEDYLADIAERALDLGIPASGIIDAEMQLGSIHEEMNKIKRRKVFDFLRTRSIKES